MKTTTIRQMNRTKSRDPMNEGRRKLYESDPAYRDLAMQRARDYRESQRVKKERAVTPYQCRLRDLVAQSKVKQWARQRSLASGKTPLGGPKTVLCLVVSELAGVVDRLPDTVTRWTKNGVIPAGDFNIVSRTGRKLQAYSVPRAERIVLALSQCLRGEHTQIRPRDVVMIKRHLNNRK